MIVNKNGTPYLCYNDEGPFSEETHEKIKIIFSIGVRGEDGKDHYTDLVPHSVQTIRYTIPPGSFSRMRFKSVAIPRNLWQCLHGARTPNRDPICALR